jgi:hypothetical protein
VIPVRVVPDDEQLRGDGWSSQINLDPAHDWSTSAFTVDTVPAGLPVAVDASQAGIAGAPYIVLSLTAAQTTALTGAAFRWNLAEDKVLARTFLTRKVEVRDR